MLDEIIVALIGFVVSVMTAYFVAHFTAKGDLEAWERNRKSLISDTAANILRDTVTAISTASHAACWLTWKAKFDLDEFKPTDIQRYDELLHEQLPKMLGGQAAIGTLCPDAAEKVGEAVEIICAEDYKIGLACIAHRKGNNVALGERHDEARKAYDSACKLCAGLGSQLMAGNAERMAR